MNIDLELENDFDKKPKKGKEKSKKNEESFPEHVPAIPFDTQKSQEKEEARKLAKKLRKAGKAEPVVVTKLGVVKTASELTRPEQEDEIVRCASNPVYFIENYLTIFDQTQGTSGMIVPFKLFDFQKDLISGYQSNRFVIANKYRQAGISTTTCAYIAWYVMFNRNRAVAIVADKLITARDELMGDVVDFIEGCPAWLRPKTGKESEKGLKDTQQLKVYDNESRLGAFASKSLRGMTPTLLFWDETAWAEKGDKFWTSAQPTLQTGGRAIMVSTPNGLDPVFYKNFMGAREIDEETGLSKNNFHAVELWWFNDPRYTIYKEEYGFNPTKVDGQHDLEWLKNKGKKNEIRIPDEHWSKERRIQMQDDGWIATSSWFEHQVKNANGDMRKIAQELLCSFLGSGDNFVAEEYLKRIEENEVSTILRQAYMDNNMWIFEEAQPGENYIMALDASAGHGEDFSTLNMLKINEIIEEKIVKRNGKEKKVKIKRHKVEQIAEYYGKVTPQMLTQIAYQFGKEYNDAYAVVDVTGGYGVMTVEGLLEIGYENVHYAEVTHKPTRDRLQGYIKKGQKVMPDGAVMVVDLIPGFFIGNNRASVLLEMQRAIHLEDVIIRSTRLLSELKTFVTVAGNRVADHKRTFHDDSIMGLAIGLYVLNFELAKFKQSKGISEKMIKAIITNNDIGDIGERNVNRRKPIISPDSTNPLNPYGANEWLFQGLKKK